MPRLTRNRYTPTLESLEDRNLPSTVAGLPGTLAIAVGDLDGDGRADLVSVRGSSAGTGGRRGGGGGGGSGGSVLLETYLNNNKGTFALTSSTPLPDVSPNAAPRVAVGDVTGDGSPDVIMGVPDGVGNIHVSLFTNDGKGGFTPDTRRTFSFPHVLETSGRVWGDPHVDSSDANWALADLNRDGALDLAVATPENRTDVRVTIVLGDGKGGFTPEQRKTWTQSHVFETRGGSSRLLGVSDLDGDGRPDLVGVGPITTDGKQETAIFMAPLPPEGGQAEARINKIEALAVKYLSSNDHILLGDVDGDGRLDLVTAVGRTLRVGRNTGVGGGAGPLVKFDWRQVEGPVLFPANGTFLGDVDGDGWLDLFSIRRASHEIAMNSVRNLKA
jgi:hypothetical protein